MATLDRPDDGAFAFDGLDRVLHEKARLGILSCLLAQDAGLSFHDLREACALTDGNLSRHLSTLEDAGLVSISKQSSGNRPLTLVRLSASGRKRFLDYLALLESIVSMALASAPKANPGGAPGFVPT